MRTPQPAEPLRHPPELIEAAKTILSSGRDEARYALAIKRLNEGTSFVNLSRPETLIEASALVLRNALACAEEDLAEARRRIADDNKAYGCELMDPCGTIWEQCAKVQQELAAERQRRETAEAQVERRLTPTPKTDALRESLRGKSDRDFAIKLIAHANQQERELAEARKDIADITEVWGHQITDYLEARHAAREAREGGA